MAAAWPAVVATGWVLPAEKRVRSVVVTCWLRVATWPSQVYGAVWVAPQSGIGVRGPVKSPGLVGWVMIPAAMFTPPPLTWQVAQDCPGLDRVVDSKSRLPSSTSAPCDVAADAVWTALRSSVPVSHSGPDGRNDRPAGTICHALF